MPAKVFGTAATDMKENTCALKTLRIKVSMQEILKYILIAHDYPFFILGTFK